MASRTWAVSLVTATLAMTALSSFTSAGAASNPTGPGLDCPTAFQPYSSYSLVSDLQTNPRTRAVLQEIAPGLARVPAAFAALSNTRTARIGAVPRDVSNRLDVELAKIPVTVEDARARCAKYDDGPAPALPADLKSPAILIFSKINGFRDGPSVDAAEAAFKAMAQRRGWSVVTSVNGASINSADLKRFNLVVWNNISGDVLTMTQRRAFEAYIEGGGGFLATHGSGGDFDYIWPWYLKNMTGAQFKNHPNGGDLHFQKASLDVVDKTSAITRGLPARFEMTDEWYSFYTDPRLTGAKVLVSIDEKTYNPSSSPTANGDLRMGDHPMVWTHCVGNGRAFYSAIGHQPATYSDPNYVRLLDNAMTWAAGMGETGCRGGREVRR